MKKKSTARYAICIRSESAEDLEVRKVYHILPDETALERGHLRVVDEFGEDYLYPAEWFIAVEVPKEAEGALAEASPTRTRRSR